MTATATSAAPQPMMTEQLVGALSAAWRAIQARHPDVPDVVLTLGSGTLGMRGTTRWGHFARSRWQHSSEQQTGELHELFVGGEGLRRGAAEVLATLLHEAAHGLATARNITGTSREGRYHNKRFKTLAEEVGLVVAEQGSRGWAATTLPPSTAEHYADVLEHLRGAITAHRRDEAPATAGTRSRNNIVLTCSCPRRIRAARAVLAEAPILCGACQAAGRPAEFTPE